MTDIVPLMSDAANDNWLMNRVPEHLRDRAPKRENYSDDESFEEAKAFFLHRIKPLVSNYRYPQAKGESMTEKRPSPELRDAVAALFDQMAKPSDAQQALTTKQRRLMEALRREHTQGGRGDEEGRMKDDAGTD